ncbi:ribosome maturation factor RimP [Candidatus Vallotia cooleyia]|uniref:ribosome maturation factor RimP n=1 Tax=Candidatus Vallotiella adelgis TaxID=1177211 RepID=UPI001D023517|nr:ribosome maturation factor RimP [Candidatus Vallotia cooleyia]
MQLSKVIEDTVIGLGYELVNWECSNRGMLHVFIDQPSGITISDCEKVTHQLRRVLNVESINYERLEVSSPGLDRPLKKEGDFRRFTGRKVIVKLKHPLNRRKSFCGILYALHGDVISLEFEGKDGPTRLDFTFADVNCARLVPQIDFRRRKQ